LVPVLVTVAARSEGQPLEPRWLARERSVAALARDPDVAAAQRELGLVMERGVALLVDLDHLPAGLGMAARALGAERTFVGIFVAALAALEFDGLHLHERGGARLGERVREEALVVGGRVALGAGHALV